MDFSDRIKKVQTTMGWSVDDLVSITQVTKSAVLQWLGQTSTPIRSMGSIRAAISIERASGFSGIWVAYGEGPIMAPRTYAANEVRSTPASYLALPGPEPRGAPQPTWQDAAIEQFGELLRQVPIAQREAVARLLDGWAREAGADHYRVALQAMLKATPSKLQSHAG